MSVENGVKTLNAGNYYMVSKSMELTHVAACHSGWYLLSPGNCHPAKAEGSLETLGNNHGHLSYFSSFWS